MPTPHTLIRPFAHGEAFGPKLAWIRPALTPEAGDGRAWKPREKTWPPAAIFMAAVDGEVKGVAPYASRGRSL